MNTVSLHLGDCLDVMRDMPSASFDSIVTDPPAGIGFMGKAWDSSRGGRDQFVAWLRDRMAEAHRLAKPGAYALVWALPRTSHWTALAIEDAGWLIHDKTYHLFGSGFPKADNRLKPAVEEWILAHKPIGRKVPLNIDACRVETEKDTARPQGKCIRGDNYGGGGIDRRSDLITGGSSLGRWPAHLVHDGSEEVLAGFPETKSGSLLPGHKRGIGTTSYGGGGGIVNKEYGGDSGSAARFFYCAKASASDREEGNTHPTVKSTALMGWLARLITPPAGDVLDCFMGSGSTGKACVLEGFSFTGITDEPDHLTIAERRINAARAELPLLAGGVA